MYSNNINTEIESFRNKAALAICYNFYQGKPCQRPSQNISKIAMIAGTSIAVLSIACTAFSLLSPHSFDTIVRSNHLWRVWTICGSSFVLGALALVGGLIRYRNLEKRHRNELSKRDPSNQAIRNTRRISFPSTQTELLLFDIPFWDYFRLEYKHLGKEIELSKKEFEIRKSNDNQYLIVLKDEEQNYYGKQIENNWLEDTITYLKLNGYKEHSSAQEDLFSELYAIANRIEPNQCLKFETESGNYYYVKDDQGILRCSPKLTKEQSHKLESYLYCKG